MASSDEMSYRNNQTPYCRHYRGDKPCLKSQDCTNCSDKEELFRKVLIIKCGALGDVLRTTSLLPALHQKGTEIHWLTSQAALPLLQTNNLIDKIWTLEGLNFLLLSSIYWNDVYVLDKEPEIVAIGKKLSCDSVYGVTLSESGKVVSPYPEDKLFVDLGLSDELKFNINEKTYHQIIAEACRLSYNGEAPQLLVHARALDQYNERRREYPNLRYIGIALSYSSRFAHKTPSKKYWEEFLEYYNQFYNVKSVKCDYQDKRVIFTFLGINDDLVKTQSLSRENLIFTGTPELVDLIAAITQLDLLISGDSLSMHIAIALGKPVIALFGPTVTQEIDLFNKGIKLVSSVSCRPCYKLKCDNPNCMDQIPMQDIIESIQSFV